MRLTSEKGVFFFKILTCFGYIWSTSWSSRSCKRFTGLFDGFSVRRVTFPHLKLDDATRGEEIRRHYAFFLCCLGISSLLGFLLKDEVQLRSFSPTLLLFFFLFLSHLTVTTLCRILLHPTSTSGWLTINFDIKFRRKWVTFRNDNK